MINFSKYVGLKFKHRGRGFDGVDCYGLLTLILKEEFGIDMPEFEYSFRWNKEGCNHIQDNVPKFNTWNKIKEPSKPLDVILFYSSPSRKIVSHMGIFLNDDKFLHISSLHDSCIERLNDHWKNRMYATMRCNFG